MMKPFGNTRQDEPLKFSQLVDNLIARGKLYEAIDILESISSQASANTRVPIGVRLLQCYINTKQTNKAEYLVTSLEAYSDDSQLVKARVHIFYQQELYSQAYKQLSKLTLKQRREPEIDRLIPKILIFMDINEYSISLESDVLRLFEDNVLERRIVENLAKKLLIYKYQIDQSSHKVELINMAKDRLFLEYLKSGHSRSVLLESVIIQIRHVLLTHSLSAMDLSEDFTPLVVAIGWQNWHNEYVHATSAPEMELINQLENLLEQQTGLPDFDVAQVEGLLLLVAMYKPLGELKVGPVLKGFPLESWPLSVKDLARQTLFESHAELEFAKKIESIGSIENSTSQRVKAQYEENPYPRWNRCVSPSVKLNYYHAMKQVWLGEGDPLKPAADGELDLLVAGCGTGKHPLQQALILDVNVTAIDITQRSLGYAAMMANRLSVDNVRFAHMDLMEVELLKKQYDVIECTGVLHHMEVPEDGLRALLKVIKPGGIIRLGLYSEIARRSVIAVRKAFLSSGMSPSLQNIRAVRKALLSKDVEPECQFVVNFGDFYATSPCRDLLFHEQEHRYTVPALAEMLVRNNLEFIGFSFEKNSVIKAFNKRFGADQLRNLSAWEAFESENPFTFAAMYQFYVKAP